MRIACGLHADSCGLHADSCGLHAIYKYLIIN